MSETLEEIERKRDEVTKDYEFCRELYKVQEQCLETARRERDEAWEQNAKLRDIAEKAIKAISSSEYGEFSYTSAVLRAELDQLDVPGRGWESQAARRGREMSERQMKNTTEGTITGLKAVLAEPEPVEPFGYLWPTGRHCEFRFTQQRRDGVYGMPLYNAPPPSAWRGQEAVKLARSLKEERDEAREALRKAIRFVEAYEPHSRREEADQNETLSIIRKVLEETK